MDIIDNLNAVKRGKLSRRAFNRSLMAAGVGLLTAPYMPRKAMASAGDHPTFFTWGGYDLDELYGSYIAKNETAPNFSIFGATEEAFTKMRGGFVVDAAHPCDSDLRRWVESGLFQPVDTSRLSNWGDVMPELVDIEANDGPDGKPWLVPFDWGGTSVTYRTDLYELEGEESWDILWDERYSGRLSTHAAGGSAWWCAAIKAGIPFSNIDSEEAFTKIAAELRQQRPLIKVYTDDMATVEQALASGELAAAMTWNSSAVALGAEGIPVRFAQPKEGQLTWLCGIMIHKDAPNLDKTYEMIDALLSEETGQFMINDYGYGHSNARAFDAFDDETLTSLGLSKKPKEILDAGHFASPQTQDWETRMNGTYEMMKAGF